jgi:predicted P-loop ATPase
LQLDDKDNRKFQVLDGGRPTALDAARRWAERGYFVVPIPFREKKPLIEGWPTLRLKPEDLPKHFGAVAQNIGLLLGEPYGITDIDLDSPEAEQLWQIFAPPTKCVFGHQSKPFSHYLFHMDPPGPSLKLVDPISKGTLLELRCLSKDGEVGRQTVVPPSVHRDTGEVIRYERGCDGDPANVDADILIRAVKKTAAACMLARYYPPAGGGRHDTELALSGVLCRAGWGEADAKEFIIGVYTAVPSHDLKAIGRVSQSIEDTYRRFAEGGDTTGIPRLSVLIEQRAVAVALDWLGIDGGKGSEVNAENWRDHLLLNLRGAIIPCVANVMIALQHAKEWDGVLNFNESAVRVQALSAPPWKTVKQVPFDWTDEDDVQAAAWMQHEGIRAPKAIVGEAIQTVAREHPFHPIRQHFENLVWDGTPRIDTWLPTYLGAAISEYSQAVGAKFLIGAVARVFRPGCKNDCCLVLEGPQGLFKSTALRILAEPWFADHIADLGSKDSQMQVHGVLILEIAELDGMSKSEASAIKSFMSSASDRFRPPYGKHVINVPRESVFAGTVNDGIKYLKDETGARRFWPVKCVHIDIEKLRRDKDQLWAEAVARFKADDSWWLDSVELNQEAEQEQAARYDADPWLEKIKAFIEGRPSVSIVEILDQCIQKPTERQMQSDKTRVGRCLRFLNWAERQVQHEGTRVRRYFPPEEP